jgi:hypothetical protein
MMSSMNLTKRYDWHIAMGVDRFRVLFPTGPAGVKAMFRDRDIENGYTRRTALRHWVMAYWRNKEPDDVFVREHLRGKLLFNWHGLSCEVQPSAFDLERAQAAKVY